MEKNNLYIITIVAIVAIVALFTMYIPKNFGTTNEQSIIYSTQASDEADMAGQALRALSIKPTPIIPKPNYEYEEFFAVEMDYGYPSDMDSTEWTNGNDVCLDYDPYATCEFIAYYDLANSKFVKTNIPCNYSIADITLDNLGLFSQYMTPYEKTIVTERIPKYITYQGFIVDLIGASTYEPDEGTFKMITPSNSERLFQLELDNYQDPDGGFMDSEYYYAGLYVHMTNLTLIDNATDAIATLELATSGDIEFVAACLD